MTVRAARWRAGNPRPGGGLYKVADYTHSVFLWPQGLGPVHDRGPFGRPRIRGLAVLHPSQ